MPDNPRCPDCGSDTPAGTEGLCPRCLLKVGLQSGPPGLETAAHTAGFTPPSPAELAPLFPQLDIVTLLGKGGMGAVYQARQPKLDRPVALKILPPEVARDPAFAERFAREARALARLNHPNIVAVYDSGQAGDLYYFLMEFVDGVNLRQALQAGTLSPEDALKIVPQLCDALQYAHDEGVVHRDIKPENILLDKRGRVKVADFGLAKLLGPGDADLTLTGTQQVMGTWHYMAPEQMTGSRAVDHRADIYSLGVTFYEMLTGELPLGRFPPPSRRAGVDARLDDVVLRTLEREPAERYQHASEVKTDVETVIRDRPRAPQPPPLPGARPTRRPAASYGTWVVIPTLVFIGVYLLSFLLCGLIPALLGLPIVPSWVTLFGGLVLLTMAFVALNVLWLFVGQYASSAGDVDAEASRATDAESARHVPVAEPPATDDETDDWKSWWLHQPAVLRRYTKLALAVLMLSLCVGFFGFTQSRAIEPRRNREVRRLEVGAIDPWLVLENSDRGRHFEVNLLTLSMGFGVLALACLQGLLVLRNWEQPAARSPTALARQVERAGTALLAAGTVVLLAWIFVLLVSEDLGPGRPAGAARWLRELAPLHALWSLFAGPFIVRGALDMRQLRHYHSALLAAGLAMVPLSVGVVVGLPIGLWAWLVLRRPEVQDEFKRREWLDKHREFESSRIVADAWREEPETLAYALGWLFGRLFTGRGLTVLVCFLGAVTVFLPWLLAQEIINLHGQHVRSQVSRGTDLGQGILAGLLFFLLGCGALVGYHEVAPRVRGCVKLAVGLLLVLHLTVFLSSPPHVAVGPRQDIPNALKGVPQDEMKKHAAFIWQPLSGPRWCLFAAFALTGLAVFDFRRPRVTAGERRAFVR